MNGTYEVVVRSHVEYESTVTIEAESLEAAEATFGHLDVNDLTDDASIMTFPDGSSVIVRAEVVDAEADWDDAEVETLEEAENDEEGEE